MPKKKATILKRAARIQQYKKNWLERRRMQLQNCKKDADTVSPKKCYFTHASTPEMKHFPPSTADNEFLSPSKELITSTPVKRSLPKGHQKRKSSAKKRRIDDNSIEIENIFDMESDISEADSEDDYLRYDPWEEEQIDEDEETNFVPFFENKNQSSLPDLVDLNLSKNIDSFEYINFNKLENDARVSEIIFGSEAEIFDSLFKKDNNNDDAPTLEKEKEVAPAGCRDKMMNYSLKLVEDQDDEMIFCSKRVLNKLLKSSKLICPDCDESKLEFQIKNPKINKSFIQSISIYCKQCKKILCNTQASERIILPEQGKVQKRAYKSSIRYVLGSLYSGITYHKGAEFLRHLCINPLSHGTYLYLLKQASSIICKKLEEMKNDAANIVKEYYSKKGVELDNGAMNVAVSFDGSWMSRGRNSKYGVAFVVECETGLILDAYLASSFCLSCCKAKVKFENDLVGFKDWKQKHKVNCDSNYDPSKSSGQMEAEAGRILFGRSLQRGLRYTTVVSDEDSSTYKTICESNPYEGYQIKKINCLNHIAKKIYRKLEVRIKQEKLGGKGIGKITQNISDHFSNFYRFAIKKYFGNYNKIREVMNASIDHHISTDEKPLHAKCSLKWCKYLMAQKNGIPISPDWHKDVRNRKYSLSEESGTFMRKIFNEMTDEKVLNKVSGKTQNMNESIHSKLWNLLPKASFRGAKHVQFCVAQICLDHNYGKRGASIADQFFMSPAAW